MVEDVTEMTVRPSGFAVCWNLFAPAIVPEPGKLRTRIVGFPGRCFSKNGAKTRA